MTETEHDHKVSWRTHEPEIGEVLSMGGEERWSVISNYSLFAPTVENLLSVSICHVHLIGEYAPPMADWQGWNSPPEFADKMLEVAIDDQTKEFLQFSINYSGHARKPGERLYTGRQIGDTPRFELVQLDFWVNGTDVFRPIEPAPYIALALYACQPVPLSEPALA
ncbi:MAG: hypothetical protein ICV77_09745 [Cyanobacteria bacterium Co-bin8]|nr:hypothetical protein [Cyanobacteria bacterium Co-bin8]